MYFFRVLLLVELSTASWATMTMPSARPAGTRFLKAAFVSVSPIAGTESCISMKRFTR